MKKLLLLACISVFALSTVRAAEPLTQGSLLLNANVSDLNIQFVDDFALTLGVRGGYFVADKLPILANVALDFNDAYTSFGLQAGLGYYFAETGSGSFFANALAGLESMKPDGGDAINVFGVTLEGGYSWFLNDRIAIDPKLILDIPFKDGFKTTFALGAGISVYL